METVRDLIRAALRLLGVYGSGDAPTSSEEADAFEALNVMLGEWGARRWVSPILISEQFALSAGVSSRTIGPVGADYTSVRPLRIEKAVVRDAAGVDTDLELENFSEYQEIPQKTQVTGPPERLTYRATYPNGTIYVHPVPDQDVTLLTDSLKPWTPYGVIGDPLNLSPEYQRALKFNLAIEIAPEYGLPLRPDIVHIAKTSLASVKRLRAAEAARPVPVAPELQQTSYLRWWY